ncbi:MAG: superoxide dismutase [Methylococcales bacterium]|nr:superoxide dismutase [Methylococcales bacterium]
MSTYSRRDFLLTSSGAIAGTLLSPSILEAKTQTKEKMGNEAFSQSGLVTGNKKPMTYKSIPGFLSKEQLLPHFNAHYGGALKGYTAAEKKIQSSILSDEPLDSSAYGALQRARTTKSNSIILHELYFEGMSNDCDVSHLEPEVKSAIEKRFGSLELWAADFEACAKASSGWALLAFHPVNGKLYNIISDAHATGVNWMATPLIVIDMYEHAYYIDYKNKKTEYISNFLEHINCKVVNERFKLV